MATTRLAWETRRDLDTSTMLVPGTFYAIGTPLAHPSYICKMVNNSNVLLNVSIDGVTFIDVCPANSFWLYDETKYVPVSVPTLPQRTQFYVTSAAAGVGLVYLVTQYLIEAGA